MNEYESIMHWREEAEKAAREAKEKEREGAKEEARILYLYGVLCSLIALVDLGIIGRGEASGVTLRM